MATAVQYINRSRKLKESRKIWEEHWQTLAYYCLPLKAHIVGEDQPGSLLPSDVYDSTAIWAAQIFGSGLYAYLTNPASRWFTLAFSDPKLHEEKRKWLREQEDIIYQVLANSNFYQPVHEVYVDFIVFGTANMYEEEDPDDYVRFYCRDLAECCIAENARGIVDTNIRFFKFTAKQAYEVWGERASEEVKQCMANQKYEELFDFLHVVGPRHDRKAGKTDARNMPWESVYIDIKGKRLLSVGGYLEFPFAVPRFMKRSATSPYGYSSSMVALPDIKMVNNMAFTILKAEEKMVDPPLQGPDDGYVLPLDTSPGALNYHRTDLGERDIFRPLYDTRIHNLDAAVSEETARREAIQKAFFVDLFLLLVNRPKMTATEVVRRVDEKMLILSPMLGRLMKEFLQPVIARTFNILVRKNVIAVPEELRDARYEIRYVSPLARAQRAAETRSIVEYVELIMQLANAQEDVLDTVDFDKVGKEVAKLEDIPPSILRSDEDVKTRRESKAAQARTVEAMKGGGGQIVTV